MMFLTLLLMAASQVASPGKAGEIVFFRPSTVMGAAVGCPIRHKGVEIVELGRGKFARWKVAPGRYILSNRTSSVEVTVADGETRYVRCTMKAGFLTSRADLQLVDAEEFRAAGDFEEKPTS